MKKHLLPFALLTLGLPTTAQTSPPEEGCMIRYQYDAAGNRISRDWYCWGNEVQSPTEPGTTADGAAAKRLLAETHMTAMPNPAKEFTTVSFTREVPNGTLELQDATGRTVRSQALRSQLANLELGGLVMGTYWLVYRSGDERIVTTLVIGDPDN